MANRSADWCILRTSGPRTLKLAASLAEAGFDVWTPAQIVRRRALLGKNRREEPAPIMPTFVFARAAHLGDLTRAAKAIPSPHPAFSIFHYRDSVPLIADNALAHLRAVEDRAKHETLKRQRHAFAIGQGVTVSQGPATGMTGVVRRSDGKFALVAFGGVELKIASFLLASDGVPGSPAEDGPAGHHGGSDGSAALAPRQSRPRQAA